MTLRITVFFLALFISSPSFAQFGKQKDTRKYYEFAAIYDSATGIDIYEKLNRLMGGDSVRYNPKGYASQGWWEDYYKGGTVMHSGYYQDGMLTTYKNFYENGQMEREFKSIDYFRYQMILYYDNGQVRSNITYYQGAEMITMEYYPNGKPEFMEEYADKCDFLKFRQFYYDNGSLQSDMQLLDKKKKKYSHKEYFENGKMQTEGTMQYYDELDNFLKEGKWNVYDETGKLIAVQEYVRGQMVEEKKI
jgi:antitoxin component YwqK of YwqJK toxin-antitoxin module